MFKSEGIRELRVRLRYNWRLIVAIFAPIILSPVAWAIEDDKNSVPGIDPNKKFRTAYVIILMATFWVLEVIPLAVTSLLPLVLFPLLGIQDAASVSKNYMKESNMIFLGAIILALAIEYSGLHIRSALRVISIFGSNPPRIMLGTMIVAATLSMWLSDTSCTTMLLPILSAITSAMFREEQIEAVARSPEDENDLGGTKGDTTQGSFNRGRRESHVFANSALQGHLNSTIRRRRRSGGGSKASLNPPNSNSNHASVNSKSTVQSINGTAASLSDSGLDEMSGISVDYQPPPRGSLSSRDVSSMSIILENVAIPADLLINEEPVKQDAPATALNTEQEKKSENLENGEFVDEMELQGNIRKMLLFAVAYSASIGGTGSLVGTGPIKVFKELIKEYKLEKSSDLVGITFTTWMGFNIPPLIINVMIVWSFLAFRYVGFKRLCKGNKNSEREKQKVKEYLREEYEKLGPISGHEIGVAIIFIVVVLLWLLRDPQLFPGWNSINNSTGTGDSTAAMLGVILLFIVPKRWSFMQCGKGKYQPEGKYEALLDWKFVSTNAPWGYILLIGSGYAIADASQKSYLSHYIGLELDSLKYLSNPSLLLIVMCLTSLITEVVSNTACASLILPILFSVSCGLKIHPIYLTMASAVTASYAFMLPISSPPNAIIFATGELRIREMLINGLFLNIVCNLVLYVAILTYGDFIFHFSTFNTYLNSNPIYQDCAFFNLTKEIKTI